MKVMGKKQDPVHLQLVKALKERIEKNGRILETIIETILLCGRQNIALSGHRVDSKYDDDPDINTGNFKALLQYRVNGGDTEFKEHIKNAPLNCT